MNRIRIYPTHFFDHNINFIVRSRYGIGVFDFETLTFFLSENLYDLYIFSFFSFLKVKFQIHTYTQFWIVNNEVCFTFLQQYICVKPSNFMDTTWRKVLPLFHYICQLNVFNNFWAITFYRILSYWLSQCCAKIYPSLRRSLILESFL